MNSLLLASQLVYVAIALGTSAQFLHTRNRQRGLAALMFTTLALPTVTGWLAEAGLFPTRPQEIFASIGLMAHPWLLLQLVWTFQSKRPFLDLVVLLGLLVSVAVILVYPTPLPTFWVVALVGYFLIVEGYVTVALLVGGLRRQGVARLRMVLAGSGSALLALIVLMAGLVAGAPELAVWIEAPGIALVIASAGCWYLGFLPPRRLRRWMQLEQLHRLLRECSGQDPDTILASLRECVESATGATEVRIVLGGEGQGLPIRDGARSLGWLDFEAPSAFPVEDREIVSMMCDGAGSALAERMRFEEQAELVARLSASNELLARASRHKSAFLANMSHELRTPLNTVLGFTELLHDERVGPVPPEQRELLNDVLGSGRHLLELIDDLLDVARIESGRLELEPETVDLQAVAEEVVTAVRPVAGGLRIEQLVEPAAQRILVDRRRLKQVLFNLLGNAVKFTDRGRVDLRISAAGPEHVRLSVSDTGIGIAPEERLRIFRPFEQLDTGQAKRFQGTGLGLALTRELVEAMGGSIGVDSELGQGSTFWARLPRQAPKRAPTVLVLGPDRLAEELGLALRHAGVLLVQEREQADAVLVEHGQDRRPPGFQGGELSLEPRFPGSLLVRDLVNTQRLAPVVRRLQSGA